MKKVYNFQIAKFGIRVLLMKVLLIKKRVSHINVHLYFNALWFHTAQKMKFSMENFMPEHWYEIQRCIQTTVKHLRWNVLRKYLIAKSR